MEKYSQREIEFRFKKSREEMRSQFISFGLMAFLTVISFIAVGVGFPAQFVIPFLLLLAIIQVLFQFYYFMHAKEEGHGVVMGFMYSGLFTAVLMIIAFLTIIWW